MHEKPLTSLFTFYATNTRNHLSFYKALVLGFRLYFTKDSTTINTAGATVRQLVNAVYERVLTEDSVQSQGNALWLLQYF